MLKIYQIETLSAEIRSLQATYKDKKRCYDTLVQRQTAVQMKFAPDRLLAQMRRAAPKLDDECEDMVEKFLDEEITVREFMSEFIKKRTRYHKMMAKLEIWKKQKK